MHVSIVIPVLNEADCVVGLLARLQPVRAAGHEVILADGGSRDATVALARPLVDRIVCPGRGRARQMNAGAAAARGDVLWFLHADSGVPAGAVRRILGAVRAGRPWGRFDVRLSGRDPMFRVIERAMNLRSRLTGIATGDQGIFVTRALFERVGGYPDIPLMEDIALSRALKGHARPACLEGPLVTSSRRWEAQGTWRTIWLMWWLRAAYRLGVSPERLARAYAR